MNAEEKCIVPTANWLAKRVEDGYYEEDGGFIRDWFVHDIELIKKAAFEEGRKAGMREADILQYRDRNDEADQRYIEGQREMRERAMAKVAEGPIDDWGKIIYKAIEALPLTPRGGEK